MSGRREEEEDLSIGVPPGHLRPGESRTQITCRCPRCGYELSVEEDQKCNAIECPRCGKRMMEVG
jgi:DNA-directed RNA polymerase subunit RPC12/RpoP